MFQRLCWQGSFESPQLGRGCRFDSAITTNHGQVWAKIGAIGRPGIDRSLVLASARRTAFTFASPRTARSMAGSPFWPHIGIAA